MTTPAVTAKPVSPATPAIAPSIDDFTVLCDDSTGLVRSVCLYGQELLDATRPSGAELRVNGRDFETRLYPPTGTGAPGRSAALHRDARLRGEHFTNYTSGYGLVLARHMGHRMYAKHPTFGVTYTIRREHLELTQKVPGPGGPAMEAPCWVDDLTLLNWNWKFWGDTTKMIFVSSHSGGPDGEFGHVGYENAPPEEAKRMMGNIWRRTYPSCIGIHGGVYYDTATGHWLAITCRRPNLGYTINLNDAGRGVCYDFHMHSLFPLDHSQIMPEIKMYWGRDHASMMTWLGDYSTHYYEEAPAWVSRTLWGEGLAWNNQPTWTAQADKWEADLAKREFTGIGYCLVTNRPVSSGTTPLGYEPDPNHGTKAEFKAMCRRMADRGVPVLIWMSHSGVQPNGADIDDDWFCRGIDGRVEASWGSIDGGMSYVNMGHPGYIAYTIKWIKFYIEECGAKGIFMDCLGFATPPDFRPRPWMRYPADASRMAIPFIESIYEAIKACDPEAILLGEGTTLEAPCNIFSVHTNPTHGDAGMGPRDFYASEINKWSPKRLTIDQGPAFWPGSGYCKADNRPGAEARNRALATLLSEHGGPRAFTSLPGDLSIHDELRLLVVPVDRQGGGRTFRLSAPWQDVTRLHDTVTGADHVRAADGSFTAVPTGIYAMQGPSA